MGCKYYQNKKCEAIPLKILFEETYCISDKYIDCPRYRHKEKIKG